MINLGVAKKDIMDTKSYTVPDLFDAELAGWQIWRLDTAEAGEDDLLIGTYEDVETEVLAQHELDELPERWLLTLVVCPLSDYFY